MVGRVGRRLAEDLGVEAEFIDSSWADQFENLIEGRVDVCLKHTNLPERALVARFVSTPMLEYLGVLFVNETTRDIGLQGLVERPGKFAVTRGSLHSVIGTRALHTWTAIETDSAIQSFDALSQGEVDVVITDDVMDGPPGSRHLRSPDGELVVVSRDASYPCVRQADDQLYWWLDNWMRYTERQGTLAHLIEASRSRHREFAAGN